MTKGRVDDGKGVWIVEKEWKRRQEKKEEEEDLKNELENENK